MWAIKRQLLLLSLNIALLVSPAWADGTLTAAAVETITHSSAEVDTSFSYNTPTTGATITPAVGEQRTIINPAGTIATLTINTPASPVNGQIWGYASTQIVTALTITGTRGATVVAPSPH